MHPSLVSLGVLHFVRGARVTRIGCGSDVAGIGCHANRMPRESDVAGLGCHANRMPREYRLYEMQEHLLPVGQVWCIRPSCRQVSCISYGHRMSRAGGPGRVPAGRRSQASASGRIPPRESLPASSGRANGRPRESRAGEDASVQQSLGPGDGASECAPPAGARADVDAHAELGGSVR